MKKRKIYCLLILVFIFTISIICYINNNSEKSFYISFQKSQVNNYLKKYLKNKSYTVAITNYSENIIQGEIYDTGSNGNLFLTTGLFLYDIEKNKYDFFEYTEKNRILKYYISDEKIYASIIEDKDFKDNVYNWQLASYDIKFKNKKILDSGVIDSPFNVPNFYYSSMTNDIYITTIKNYYKNNKKEEEFSIYYINNNNIEQIISYNGNVTLKNGELSCGQFDIHFNNNNLIYCITDYANYQTIYSLNILTKENKIIYNNDIDDGWVISSYRNDNEILFVGKYDIKNKEKNKISYIDLKTGKYKEMDSTSYYGRNNFINNSLLFHKTDKWEFYNYEKNKLKVARVTNYKEHYFLPAYININSTSIMAMDINNNLYIGNIEYK